MKHLFLLILLTTALVAPVWADAQADNLQEGRAAARAGDYDRAVRLLLPLAKDGNATAQNTVGALYANGWGVAQDHYTSAEWYRKAAEQGNAKGQMNLGSAYKQGLGVQRDYAEAIKWYRRAAEQGYAQGMGSLGLMYKDGLGVARDYAEAIKWYRKAAEQGDRVALYNLATMYAMGRGVQRDYAEAAEWYRKAAKRGNVMAMSNLGYMSELGQGMAPDREAALKWYRMAAKRGDRVAKERLKALSGAAETKKGPARATLEQARQAPPRLLARGYLTVDEYLRSVKLARRGATVHTPEGTINSSNAETYGAVYAERLSTYTTAIDRRGYGKIAGTYSARVTNACKAVPSALTGLVVGGMAKEITITQDDFKVKLTQKAAVEGQSRSIAHDGIIVENVLVVTDATAPDFTFIGNTRQDEIELRPWVADIRATYSRYPPNFPPRPNWEALSKCALTLKKER